MMTIVTHVDHGFGNVPSANAADGFNHVLQRLSQTMPEEFPAGNPRRAAQNLVHQWP